MFSERQKKPRANPGLLPEVWAAVGCGQFTPTALLSSGPEHQVHFSVKTAEFINAEFPAVASDGGCCLFLILPSPQDKTEVREVRLAGNF